MAATLLEIKSRMLLPNEKNDELNTGDLEIDEAYYEEDARNELVEKLLEYKRFKQVSLLLREKERNASRIFTRSTDFQRQPEEILEIDIGPNELLGIYHALVRRRINPPVHRVVLEKIGIMDRINEIRKVLKKFKGEITFGDLIKDKKSRYEVVLSFMAILEMSKNGELAIDQKENFQPITMKKRRMANKPEPAPPEAVKSRNT
jgi:segregation and condensation protein A